MDGLKNEWSSRILVFCATLVETYSYLGQEPFSFLKYSIADSASEFSVLEKIFEVFEDSRGGLQTDHGMGNYFST